MNKIIQLITLILGFIINHPIAQKTEHQIDKLMKPWESKSKPGIAVAVNKDNETVYRKYFGVSNLENLTPISSDTKFLIASVSKQFTAFAIVLLAEEGKLNLEDDIRKYLPEIPDYSYKVSIMNLLNHTSGLRDADDLNGLVGAGLSDYVSFNDSYKLIKQQKNLNFIPGTKYDYSNSGYILQAKIVENISAKSFREFMQDRVFKPLEMTNTLVFDNPFETIGNKAISYYSNDGKNYSTNNLFSAVYGSTGIYTTLSDLNKWAKNFTNQKVGSKKLFALMKTKGLLSDGAMIDYGLGQEMKVHKGHQAVFHGGGQGAYRAYLLRFPESELSITILSNSSYSTAFIIDYAYQIADMFLTTRTDSPAITKKKDNSVEPKKPITISKSLKGHYIGNYQIQPGLIFTIKQNNDDLELFITGNDKAIPLQAISTNEFILMDANNGYKIVFPEGVSRQVNSLSYYQGDFEYKGNRVYLVDFDKDNIKWEDFEGLYYSEELNTVYMLKYEDEVLSAIHARNTPINLSAHQPDVFNGSVPYFQEIKFKRDESKKVVTMTVSGSRSKDIDFIKFKSSVK